MTHNFPIILPGDLNSFIHTAKGYKGHFERLSDIRKLTYRNEKYIPQYSMLDFDSHTTSAHTTTDTKDISNAWKISENLPTETKNTYRNTQC